MTHLETTSGALVTVETSVNIRYGYDIRGEVVGEDGTAALADDAPVVLRHAGGRVRGTATRPRWSVTRRHGGGGLMGSDAADSTSQAGRPPTMADIANDHSATGLLQILVRNGVRVPEDPTSAGEPRP